MLAPGSLALGALAGGLSTLSPCVLPLLPILVGGAAATLAAQGRDLGDVALVMVVFGLGAAVPLILIASLSREALLRWRGGLSAAGRTGKVALGVLMLALGVAILTGLDHRIEASLVAISPAWLTSLTTQY